MTIPAMAPADGPEDAVDGTEAEGPPVDGTLAVALVAVLHESRCASALFLFDDAVPPPETSCEEVVGLACHSVKVLASWSTMRYAEVRK